MKITLDTTQPLAPLERKVLETLLRHNAPDEHLPAEPAKKAEPAEKAEPAKTKRKTKAEPAQSPVDEAIDLARALIRDGDAASVTALLSSVGAERVSAMSTEQAEKFIAQASK